MNEAFITYIHANVHHTGFPVCRGLTTEEEQVAGLQVTEVGSDINVFTHICLLRGVARNDDIMHEKNSTHKTTAIHSLRWSACPQIGNSHQGVCRTDDAGSILLQSGTPFLLRHGDGLGDISGAPVGIDHLIKCTTAPLPLQTVARHDIGDGLRSQVRLGIDKAVMGSHHNLFSCVPVTESVFRHQVDAYAMHPCDVVVRRLYPIPTIVLQHADGHPQQTLGHHLWWKVRIGT